MSPSPLPDQIAERLPGETPALDAQVLLAHVTKRDRTWLLAHPEADLSPEQEAALETAIRRLQDGVPLPYVLGRWEFFGLDFEVTPDVLIPRPETELLVETALDWVRTHPRSFYRFLDVGTGSGCIPVTLAVHVPRADIVATDISPAALAVARRNAQRHGVGERIAFIECDLLPLDDGPRTADDGATMVHDPWSVVRGPSSTIDIVTANLPYIPTETLKELAVYRHEPALALDGGADGLELIRRLLDRLKGEMEAESLVLLEIESGQGRDARALAEQAFRDGSVGIKKDLAGHDRLVVIET